MFQDELRTRRPVLAYVVLNGCKIAVANELRGLDPWDPEFGMPVKVVWKPKEERQGTVTGWWFEPADGWKPGPMNPEKERMKEQPLNGTICKKKQILR